MPDSNTPDEGNQGSSQGNVGVEPGVEAVKPDELRQLYRSRTNRIIAGVAGGIGEYLGVDPTIVRLIWVVLALTGGVGIIAYFAAWIIIPECPRQEASEPPENISTKTGLMIGLILVALGVWFLLANLDLVPVEIFFTFHAIRLAFWPVVLILIGVLIIMATSRRGLVVSREGKTLYRSRTNRKLAGVAGGLADYFGIDATLVRLAWAIFTIIAPPAGTIAYIIAAVVIPEEPRSETSK